ncbi:phosphate ABC transporter substrate-binding protein, PhoT family (TC 3.A.1.7.1) [Thermoactinomyces sp. DSM 45891]|uniref:PstS family phosphate ABC transporter substrate-binding protein n=1 Tax=Thermoactinomyces sp. DSM 45891 TaxID=1761907 RepID=UPI00091CF42F|nr:PstS family phosphate ABC transporter substrate-binding protein [Thermoactinomyces sp. DSM 45891]SFX12537.1 phosphate ABC transporter substrate-binding protein, PhoT family (TC 3.A.1.7.1) [Thermoactinomyces sp. DSM 45891]
MSLKKLGLTLVAVALTASSLTGCGQGDSKDAGATKASGSIKIDGSSTVFPITEAVAEEFQKANPNVKVTIGVSGTGGGFKKFAAGDLDISNASRTIKDAEKAQATTNKVDYLELPVAYDGISLVVNKANTWVDKLTVAELKKIWEPGSKVKTWKDVRPSWPAEPIKLYGPGTDSGTFEYFTEAIVGEAKKSRADYNQSEDDNVLVTGVKGDKNSLGYFGFSYYEENAKDLKLVPIDSGEKTVTPTMETIKDGSYKPLSRPLFIYVSKNSLQKPEVKSFITYYMENAEELTKAVYYVPLKKEEYQAGLSKVN